jgi:hypothetical protein
MKLDKPVELESNCYLQVDRFATTFECNEEFLNKNLHKMTFALGKLPIRSKLMPEIGKYFVYLVPDRNTKMPNIRVLCIIETRRQSMRFICDYDFTDKSSDSVIVGAFDCERKRPLEIEIAEDNVRFGACTLLIELDIVRQLQTMVKNMIIAMETQCFQM